MEARNIVIMHGGSYYIAELIAYSGNRPSLFTTIGKAYRSIGEAEQALKDLK